MSDPTDPGLPPDLPPEYAEAYRRGYERAYRQAAGEKARDPEPMVPETPAQDADAIDSPHPEEPQPDETQQPDESEQPEQPEGSEPEAAEASPTRVRGPLFADEDVSTATIAVPMSALLDADADDPDPTIHRPSHRADESEPDGAPFEGTYEEPSTVSEERAPGERPPWLVPALLAGAVLVLLLGAYGIGRLVSDSMNNASGAAKTPQKVVLGGDAASSPSGSPSKTHKASGAPYGGQTEGAAVASASASCESAPGVDAAGNKVSYAPENVYDGDMSTAWRCDGNGVGDKLTIELGDSIKVGQVGLIPGYAKLDPRTGENRYKENNRITKVRWTFSDGTVVEQSFDPSPSKRSMQNKRIPVVKANRVVVEVLSSEQGPRNTIAVSEVRIGEVKG